MGVSASIDYQFKAIASTVCQRVYERTLWLTKLAERTLSIRPPNPQQEKTWTMSADVSVIELWTVKRVAECLGMSASWVYREAKAGNIPGIIYMGGRVRFIALKVRQWLENGGGKPRRT
jgi:excisionase family DNA binding protein